MDAVSMHKPGFDLARRVVLSESGSVTMGVLRNSGQLTATTITHSVLDRLQDSEPDAGFDRPLSLTAQVSREKEFVRAGIEALLNTRRCHRLADSGLPELSQSVLSYGVESFVSANLETEAAKLSLARRLERSLSHSEPRLKNVSVTIFVDRSCERRMLRMCIEGYLAIQHQSALVRFDTKLDYPSQQITVEVPDV
jgi:type VI secretion system protein ImpF